MKICRAENCHIPGMLELLKQVGGVHHDIRPDLFRTGAQKYGARELETILRDPMLPVFVAVENGFVVGYCFCQEKDFRNNPVMTDRKELYIDDLCVDEGHRGQKIASALYHYVVTYAAERGFSFLTLNVWCGNVGAMAFYEHMGMKPRSITMEMNLEEDGCWKRENATKQ